MRKASFFAAVALAIGVTAVLAAEFWQNTPYTDWSDKDVSKMLTDSPWARGVPLDMSAMRGNSGGGGGGMGGGGGRCGGGGGRGGGGGGMQQRSIIIRWVSAMPMKQALIKTKYGDKAGSDEAKKMLEMPDTQYVVTLIGIPGQLARNDPDKVKDQLKSATTLNRKGKDAIVPDTVEMHPQNGQLAVIIRCPRANPITLDDKEVEFSTKLGSLVIKRKFKLSEMEFNGKLEL
jgi:hypothetical protein